MDNNSTNRPSTQQDESVTSFIAAQRAKFPPAFDLKTLSRLVGEGSNSEPQPQRDGGSRSGREGETGQNTLYHAAVAKSPSVTTSPPRPASSRCSRAPNSACKTVDMKDRAARVIGRVIEYIPKGGIL